MGQINFFRNPYTLKNFRRGLPTFYLLFKKTIAFKTVLYDKNHNRKPMTNKQLEDTIAWLENLLREFREAKREGKETNSNEVRAESISKIEETTRRLESYMRNNNELLERISGKDIDVATKIDWDDVVRPAHFEEDLQEMIKNLKKKV